MLRNRVTRMALPRKDKAPIIVPASPRRRAGIKPDQPLEFKGSGGVITTTAKPEVLDDEYTPAQRRKIDRSIAKGLADVKAGRIYGPFDSVAEMARSVEAEIRARRTRKKRINRE
jgi:bifunctional DNA-binding transcriptional regulator/antitoxin component of YhaV-PrlF toxin-antitoxin module